MANPALPCAKLLRPQGETRAWAGILLNGGRASSGRSFWSWAAGAAELCRKDDTRDSWAPQSASQG
jgi:hypothetical protein